MAESITITITDPFIIERLAKIQKRGKVGGGAMTTNEAIAEAIIQCPIDQVMLHPTYNEIFALSSEETADSVPVKDRYGVKAHMKPISFIEALQKSPQAYYIQLHESVPMIDGKEDWKEIIIDDGSMPIEDVIPARFVLAGLVAKPFMDKVW